MRAELYMKKIIFILVGLLFLNILSSVSALNIGVHIPEKYTYVAAGERFYFEIDIRYPENPSRKDLMLEYEILTQDGKLIAQAKTSKAVETQASFIDFIVIPEKAKNGLYIINVKVKDFETLNEEASSSFNITTADDITTFYLAIIFSAIVLVGMLVILNIILGRKRE